MLRTLLALLSLVAFAAPLQAQTWPTKQIRLIVPFPPGGGTDFVSRTVANELAKSTGWTIVVENKPGAGGTLGLIEATRAAPDGHDIVMGQADNMVIAPALQKNLSISPTRDLTPVIQVASQPFLLMGEVNSKYKTLNDVIAAAKAAPAKITYGTAGNGTFTHLLMELLQKEGGFQMVQVPYKGASPAITDLLGGHIAMAALSVASGMPHIQGGKVRGLAVTSLTRSPALADVPTVAELGYKGFEANGWLGILVPNGVPPATIARLNSEIAKVMQSPEVRKTLLAQGVEARSSTPAEFGTLIKDETTKWHKIVETAGIKAD
jgi:tripartite-type tricarboxylate transporter receptor subunit TctC